MIKRQLHTGWVMKTNNEIIKCLKCGQVLIYGMGVSCLFSPGTSIECRNCGNKHIFGNDIKNIVPKNY